MISKTESGRVSKEIPGSGSGSGTRWALGGEGSTRTLNLYYVMNGRPLINEVIISRSWF